MRPRVLVTNAEAKSMLPVVRSLGSKGMEIHAASTRRLVPGFFSRYVSRRLLYSPPDKSPDEFVETITKWQKRFNYDVVIPVGDDEIEVLSRHRHSLPEDIRLAIPAHASFIRARDKEKTLKTAMDIGVPCPRTFFPADEPIEDIGRRAAYPVLVKPNISNGARGIVMVETAGQLAGSYKRVREQYGECAVQEYIPGGGRQFKTDLLMGRDHEVLASIVYQKLRYYPVNGGSSTLVRTVRHDQITDYAVRMLKSLEWIGFADFDFIEDPRDGIVKLMEINPRFPESLSITLFAGIDFPLILYRLARGEHNAPVEGYQLDRYARFLAGDLLWFLKSPGRFRAEPGFFRFFSSDTTYYVESIKDIGPTIGYLLENLSILFDANRFRERFLRGYNARKSGNA